MRPPSPKNSQDERLPFFRGSLVYGSVLRTPTVLYPGLRFRQGSGTATVVDRAPCRSSYYVSPTTLREEKVWVTNRARDAERRLRVSSASLLAPKSRGAVARAPEDLSPSQGGGAKGVLSRPLSARRTPT